MIPRNPRHLIVYLGLALATACADGTPIEPAAAPGSPAMSQVGSRVLHVPAAYSSIQAAVDAAGAGDIIQIRAGVYPENVVIRQSGIRLHASAGAILDGDGIGGTGIHAFGTATTPVTDIEISGLQVRGYVRGIIVQWASNVRLHRNEVRNNSRDGLTTPGVWDGRGIVLENTLHSAVTNNTVAGNGHVGLTLWAGSAYNLVQGNRVHGNGGEIANHDGNGLVVTGLGSSHNRVLANDVLGNNGRGIAVQRPAGPNPLVGNVVAQNRVHDNQRGGIVVGGAVTQTLVVQNEARGNALSGLAPCGNCDLVEMSIGGNTWERNRGAFNLTDPCGP
jgi:parallel beta-helix repeat protein